MVRTLTVFGRALTQGRLKKLGIVTAVIAALLVLPYAALDKERLELDGAERAKAPGRFARLSIGAVHYELSGPEDGPVAVLVHGFSVPCYIWDPTFEALKRAGYRVLRFDLFGRGYSDRPDAAYDLDLFVTQLAELTENLRIKEPFHLAGLSMGGPIAAAYTARFPNKVRSLTLIDPFAEPMSTGDLFPLTVPLLGEYFAAVALLPFIMPGNQMKDFHRLERFPNWLSKYEAQMRYKGYRRAILSTLRNLIHRVEPLSLYEAAGETGVPVLLIRGESDRTVTAEHADRIRRAVPGIIYREIEEAAHIPHYERPDVVNPILLDFLAGRLEQLPLGRRDESMGFGKPASAHRNARVGTQGQAEGESPLSLLLNKSYIWCIEDIESTRGMVSCIHKTI